MSNKITKEEYLAGLSYTKRATLKLGNRVLLPCGCGRKVCQGWGLVLNDTEVIKRHKQLYSE